MRQPAMPVAWSVDDILDWLRGHASATVLDEMGPRYGIHTSKAFGVPMAQMKRLGKQIGVDHRLAVALWDTGWYEARIVAAMIDDPGAVTGEQMDRWCASSAPTPRRRGQSAPSTCGNAAVEPTARLRFRGRGGGRGQWHRVDPGPGSC